MLLWWYRWYKITASYASVLELVRFLNIEGTVPSRETTGSDRPDETIGTGDASTTKFYLDQAYIINSTYSLRYSAAEGTAGTALVETTDYALDKDDGTLTLTATGVTTVDTNSIFGQYSYCLFALTDTVLQAALDRAQVEIDDITDTHFATGTDTTPDYVQETNEKHDGKGRYDRGYFLLRYPLPNVSTTVSGTAVTADDTTVFADNTKGFLDSGVIGVGSDKIVYTSKSGSAFNGCTGVDAAHATAIDIKPYAVEVSTSAQGATPTWQIQAENTDFDVDLTTGRVHLYTYDFYLDEFSYSNPPRLVPNRFRATYIQGHDTIPADIKRLCLMIAAKEIKHMIVNQKLAQGIDEFSPEMIDVDQKWIDSTLQRYASMQSVNVWGYLQ